MRRVPQRDKAIEAALSERFRDGRLYAYSLEGGVWSTWTIEHDWLATERQSGYRCACAPGCRRGPLDWEDRGELLEWLGLDAPAPKRLSKAELLARLRAMASELPAAALAVLDAA